MCISVISNCNTSRILVKVVAWRSTWHFFYVSSPLSTPRLLYPFLLSQLCVTFFTTSVDKASSARYGTIVRNCSVDEVFRCRTGRVHLIFTGSRCTSVEEVMDFSTDPWLDVLCVWKTRLFVVHFLKKEYIDKNYVEFALKIYLNPKISQGEELKESSLSYYLRLFCSKIGVYWREICINS